MTLLPTLNRTKLLTRFLQSVKDTETTTAGWVIVDKSDWMENLKAYEAIEMPKGWGYRLTNGVTMGDKIREVWDEVLDVGTEWVNVLNDDHVIKTKHWDQKLLKKLDGTNFVTCNDGWMSPRKAAGATIFSMPLLKAVGIPIYPEGMKHLFIDDLWETIGKSTGTWDIDHSVLIEHHNQLKLPQERDSTFYEVYGRNPDLTQHPQWKNDNAVYRQWLQENLLEAKNRVRTLRGQITIKYVS